MRGAAIILMAAILIWAPKAQAQQAMWEVGPSNTEGLNAIYRHAEGDIDGDGRPDVAAYCSAEDFVITDNTWPGIKGAVSATLYVGEQSYEVEAVHLTNASLYAFLPYIRNAVWMTWPAEEAPEFSDAGPIRVSIGDEVRDYGEGATAALQSVREQCVRNVRGPPYN